MITTMCPECRRDFHQSSVTDRYCCYACEMQTIARLNQKPNFSGKPKEVAINLGIIRTESTTEEASVNDAKNLLLCALDPNVESVRAKLLQRSQVGPAKEWITSQPLETIKKAQEEVLDLAVYLEAAIRQMEAQG